jgi:UDP-N-acetylglucosamine transferase subunit ALG13
VEALGGGGRTSIRGAGDMILVTVGAQMPFDRLLRTVDAWAAAHPDEEVFAQIGPGAWKPQHIRWVEFLQPDEYRKLVEQSKLIISHAGMGTVLTALELGKPLLLLPRRGELRETRNDHQVDTARQLQAAGRATIAFDEKELAGALENLGVLASAPRISAHASPELLETIRNFIRGGVVNKTSREFASRSPSPGLRRAQSSRTPGEGGGEGLTEGTSTSPNPHPGLLPAYDSTELVEVREKGSDSGPGFIHDPCKTSRSPGPVAAGKALSRGFLEL